MQITTGFDKYISCSKRRKLDGAPCNITETVNRAAVQPAASTVSAYNVPAICADLY